MRSRLLVLGFTAFLAPLGVYGYTLFASPPPAVAASMPARALDLASLGVRLDVPADAEVTELPRVAALVTGQSVAVTVSTPVEDDARTLTEAWQEAAELRGKNLAAENLSDGWVVTFQHSGVRGTRYWVTMLRSIGGRPIRCATTTSSPELQRTAIDACKSLRPLG